MAETFGAFGGFAGGGATDAKPHVIIVTSERTIIVPWAALPGTPPKDYTADVFARLAALPGAQVIPHGVLQAVKVKGKSGRASTIVLKTRDSQGRKSKIMGALVVTPDAAESDNALRAMGLAGLTGAMGPMIKRAYDKYASQASK